MARRTGSSRYGVAWAGALGLLAFTASPSTEAQQSREGRVERLGWEPHTHLSLTPPVVHATYSASTGVSDTSFDVRVKRWHGGVFCRKMHAMGLTSPFGFPPETQGTPSFASKTHRFDGGRCRYVGHLDADFADPQGFAQAICRGQAGKTVTRNVDVPVFTEERAEADLVRQWENSVPLTVKIDCACEAPRLIERADLGKHTASVAPLRIELARSKDTAEYFLTGRLPQGVSFDSNKGVLFGATIEQGTYEFEVRGEAACSDPPRVATRTYRLQVCSPSAQLTSGEHLPPGTVETPYSTVLRSAGSGEVKFTAMDAQELPPGLSLGLDGVLSGTPTKAGSFHFEVITIDECDASSEALVHLHIAALPEPEGPGTPEWSGVADNQETLPPR